jgi:hypothetical protein
MACRAEKAEARVTELEQQLATMTEERDAATYIPGSWECSQCSCVQVLTVLYIQSGAVGPNTDTVPLCPNDGILMHRSTWRDRIVSDEKYIDKLLAQLAALTLTWTKERPDAKDFQWYMYRTDRTARPYALIFYGGYWRFGSLTWMIGNPGEEWAGPIQLPKERQ